MKPFSSQNSQPTIPPNIPAPATQVPLQSDNSSIKAENLHGPDKSLSTLRYSASNESMRRQLLRDVPNSADANKQLENAVSHFLLHGGNLDTISLHLDNGADITKDVLDLAIQSTDNQLLTLLLRRSANVESMEHVLTHALENKNSQMIRTVFNAVSEDRQTPPEYLVQNEKYQEALKRVAELCVQKGDKASTLVLLHQMSGDCLLKNHSKALLDLAVKEGQISVVNHLLCYKAFFEMTYEEITHWINHVRETQPPEIADKLLARLMPEYVMAVARSKLPDEEKTALLEKDSELHKFLPLEKPSMPVDSPHDWLEPLSLFIFYVKDENLKGQAVEAWLTMIKRELPLVIQLSPEHADDYMPTYFEVIKISCELKSKKEIANLLQDDTYLHTWLGVKKKTGFAALFPPLRTLRPKPVGKGVERSHLEWFIRNVDNTELKKRAKANLELFKNQSSTLTKLDSDNDPSSFADKNVTSSASIAPAPIEKALRQNSVSSIFTSGHLNLIIEAQNKLLQKTQNNISKQVQDIYADRHTREFYGKVKQGIQTALIGAQALNSGIRTYEPIIGSSSKQEIVANAPIAINQFISNIGRAFDAIPGLDAVSEVLKAGVNTYVKREFNLQNDRWSSLLDVSADNINLLADTIARALTLHLKEKLLDNDWVEQKLEKGFAKYLVGDKGAIKLRDLKTLLSDFKNRDKDKELRMIGLLATDFVCELMFAAINENSGLPKQIAQSIETATSTFATDHLKSKPMLEWLFNKLEISDDITIDPLLIVWGERDSRVIEDEVNQEVARQKQRLEQEAATASKKEPTDTEKAMQKMIEEVRATMEKMNTTIKNLTQETAALRNDVTENKKEIGALKQQNAKNEKEVGALKQQNAEQAATIAKLQAEVDTIKPSNVKRASQSETGRRWLNRAMTMPQLSTNKAITDDVKKMRFNIEEAGVILSSYLNSRITEDELGNQVLPSSRLKLTNEGILQIQAAEGAWQELPAYLQRNGAEDITFQGIEKCLEYLGVPSNGRDLLEDATLVAQASKRSTDPSLAAIS